MRIRNALFLALLAAAPAMATVYNPQPQQATIHEAYSASLRDYLYTTPYEAATSPGYTNNGAFMYIERFPQVGTVPLRRFWKGAPQNDHIYLTTQADINYVLSNGYADQGVAGYVYPAAQPGSAATYRLHINDFSTSDLVHRFARNDSERLSQIQQGWTDDNAIHFRPGTGVRALPSGAFVTGYPALAGGAVMTRRCNASITPSFCNNYNAFTWEANYRDNFWGYRSVNVPKPAGTNVQRLQFDLWTPDFFKSAALGANNEHIVIGLHGGLYLNESNIEQSAFEGQALTLGSTQCGDGRAQLEMFWRTPNSSGAPQYNGHNVQTCPAGTNVLANNQEYRVVILASDGGEIRYTISPKNGASIGAPVIQQNYVATAHFPSGVPTATAYFLAASTTSNRDYSVYLSNIAASWQNGF